MVIRARNAAADLSECLPAVRGQRLPDGVALELVLVDNESQDNSRVVGELHGARIVPISAGEFTWGRALNRGIGATDADVVVLLSADAVPVNDQWLAEMARPFDDERIAAVYGRQEPRPGAPIDEVVRLRRAFDGRARELTAERVEADLISRRWVCSNACAAVRRSVWRDLPFDEESPASEEVPWIRSVLAAGYRAEYRPGARVYHSHRESVLRFAVRTWEFYLKDVREKGSRPLGPVRAAGSIVRRRLTNCLSGAAGPGAVLVGVGRLPLECVALLSLAAASRKRAWYEWLRQRSR